MDNMQAQTIHTKKTAKTFCNDSVEGVGVLVGLGISERQAQVYLALLRTGGGRARVISGLTSISRQDIYRLFAELQTLGLIRQRLTVPVSYSPMPIGEVTRLLLDRKIEELSAMTAKAERLTEKLAQAPAPVAVASKPCFGEVFEGERGRHYQVAVGAAEVSVEVVCSWVRFRQLCFCFEAELRAALKRGVALRFVVEKPPNHHLPRWVKPSLSKSKFELRTLTSPPDAALAIFDGKQAAVAFNPEVRITQGVDLWTVHPTLVAACRAYFCRIWDSFR
ncbi:MAG: TrmB family transcriptional regulator [Candidatus Bathyarchaeia archaeon]|jgi:sugar-specific transcriptional regulator TrmB